MTNLFNEEEPLIIRTLGFYQPFGTLMLHGKLETRWLRTGKKPPFPKGRYLFYTTQKDCTTQQLMDWSGTYLLKLIYSIVDIPTNALRGGYAIGMGDLANIRLLTKNDENRAFVKFEGTKDFYDEIKNRTIKKTQWALEFKDVKRIVPFAWELEGRALGKQGVGIMPEEIKHKIKFLPF